MSDDAIRVIVLAAWLVWSAYQIGWSRGFAKGSEPPESLLAIRRVVRKARDQRRFIGGNYSHTFKLTITVDDQPEEAELVFRTGEVVDA